ncbi:ABC transporter permease, partial [Acetobacterium tundrae]
MGDLGKLAALLLLILQLTSCGGTFPMETLPKFFNVLYPFMPMTYSVKVFKDSISGVITDEFWNSFIILIIFFVVFFVATILLSIFKKRKADKKTIVVSNELDSDELF